MSTGNPHNGAIVGPGSGRTGLRDLLDGTDSGPVVGNHRIEIEATDFQGFEIDNEAAFASQMQATGMSPVARNPVPAIYDRASMLMATVTDSDGQRFVFELKSAHGSIQNRHTSAATD